MELTKIESYTTNKLAFFGIAIRGYWISAVHAEMTGSIDTLLSEAGKVFYYLAIVHNGLA